MHIMLPHHNILTSPPLPLLATQEINDQLQECEQNCKAVYHHIITTYAKVLRAIKEEKDDSLQLAFYFNKFAEGIAEAKADKISLLRRRSALIIMREHLKTKKHKLNRRQSAVKQAETTKLRKLFSQWQKIIRLQKSSSKLAKLMLSQSLKELLLLLKQNKDRNAINKLTGSLQSLATTSLHAAVLKRISFQSFIINLKMGKVEHRIKTNNFKKLIRSIKIYNKYSKQYIQYRNRKLLNRCFQYFKQIYHQSIADHFRRRYILACHFFEWKNNRQFLISERELQKSNETIASIFRQRKNRALIFGILCAWREQIKQSKEMRHHNSVLNQYTDLKYKEILLRRYFQMLKNNRINNKIRSQYYEIKLKRKAIDSLKLNICQSLQKQEKIIAFLQKMERKKYFDRIRLFNQQERAKVDRFRLNKMFTAFTFTVVFEYYQKNNRAIAYYQRNLMFKAIFALKQENSFLKKASYCIIYINAIRPLQRWLKQHRSCLYQQQRQWFILKKIFREWKLLVIRRDSEKRLTRQFKVQDSVKVTIPDESKMQAFEFDNIMATIAKIRKNFITEKQETLKNDSQRWPAVQTPSQEIDFSYSQENIQEND